MTGRFKGMTLLKLTSIVVLAGIGLWMALGAFAFGGSTTARARPRDLGIAFGTMKAGPLNAITDVAGVRVGHCTLKTGDDIRTGVTAVLPHGDNLFLHKVPAAIDVANGFGKLAGSTQVNELGQIESPILLTNTLSVAAAQEGGVHYMLALPGNENVRSVNVVVGECNDGYLNDIRGMHVAPRHAQEAIRAARTGPVAEGSVGAGTGTICHRFKGGIGTSSRVLPQTKGGYLVGVLVQTNFGRDLHIDGVPVGRVLKKVALGDSATVGDGSCMIVVATDAPLDSGGLRRLARRAMLGLARTGGVSANGSGDYVIAFSTAKALRQKAGAGFVGGRVLHAQRMTPLFAAVIEATQEAVINSLFAATDSTGRDGHSVNALPVDRTLSILREYRHLK